MGFDDNGWLVLVRVICTVNFSPAKKLPDTGSTVTSNCWSPIFAPAWPVAVVGLDRKWQVCILRLESQVTVA